MNFITRSPAYYATYAVGFALMLTLCLLRCKTFRISRARAAAEEQGVSADRGAAAGEKKEKEKARRGEKREHRRPRRKTEEKIREEET